MKTTKLLCALATCIGVVGVANAAHATQYKLTLDCHSPSGVPSHSWSKTTATIYVTAYYEEYGDFIGSTTIGSFVPSDCTVEDSKTFTFDTSSSSWLAYYMPGYSGINSFRVWTNTNTDAFWLDHVTLKNSSGTALASWGSDDAKGFCVSGTVGSYASNCEGGATFDSWYLNL